jgi:DNA polymerase (family X)
MCGPDICGPVGQAPRRHRRHRLDNMARPNDEVGAVLAEYSDLIAITGGPAYRARVYEKAARSVAGHPVDLSTLDVDGLQTIPNVGASIADKIAEYLRTGRIGAVEELRTKVPRGVRELTTIPTLGPRKAMVLYETLGISTVQELLDALDAGKLHGLKGFGPKTEQNLRHGIDLLHQIGGRVRLDVAWDLADEIMSHLSRLTGCERCMVAGSLRRTRDTVGDIDVLAAATSSRKLMSTFTTLDVAADVIARGETKSSIRTAEGLQVDLRVVRPETWGAVLQYFTGSKAHNIRTRAIAARAKLKLSEYGLFRVPEDSTNPDAGGELVVSEAEQEVYERLGLPWIPPPLREDRGEIEAALENRLPTLVTERHIRGDLHSHTNLTDGVATLEEMVEAAAARGYAYFAITDHAPNLFMQRMTDDKMLRQRERIRALARSGRFGTLALLHGTELNIDPDGEVDWPPDFLAGFDICVASVHSHFNQSQAETTKRLIRACENPYVHILGHPTGRLIGRRPAVDVDLDAVFEACAHTGTALEINAAPDRLDLNDENILRAKRYDVRFALDTDAHAVGHLDFLRYGVGTAQRGWLTPDDVINSWPLRRLTTFLRRKAERGT